MKLTKKVSLCLLAGLAFALPVRAVQYDINTDTYVATPPDDTGSGSSVTGWDSGWNGSGVTGWDYVGQVNGTGANASGVYLGDGWVLTAAHVGAGTFTLHSGTYTMVPGSAQSIFNDGVDTAIDPSLAGTTADLTLFQISTSPSLPALTLALDPPTVFDTLNNGSSVVMIGYGGGSGETWGENNVTQINQTVPLLTYDSLDFFTENGTFTNINGSITNMAQLVGGDSGGGDFIYSSVTGQWELAGINEGYLQEVENGPPVGSAMVQLSDYDLQIEAITGVPEPSPWLLLGIGLGAVWGWSRRQQTRIS